MAAGASLALGARAFWRSRVRDSPRRALKRISSEGVEAVPLALMQSTGVSLCEGNSLRWCDDDGIFDSLAKAMSEARHSIHIDVYIWKPGDPGTELAQLAARRAREGLPVRILVDPLGSGGFDEELKPLLETAGCEVRYFRSPTRKPMQFWGRNHRKLVVVDGAKGFTGGFGIAKEWVGTEEIPRWRDSNVCIEGPVVRQMQQAFAAHWMETGGQMLPAEEFERSQQAGSVRACFVSSMDVKGSSNARWVTHIALGAARERLWVANAYFVPAPELLDELAARAREGIDVQLLLPGPHLDHIWVRWLQRAGYRFLRRSGVHIHEYQPAMMHAKTILVDRSMVVVGSINLDPLSQNVLEEGALVAIDEDVARALEDNWRTDLQKSKQIG